MWVAMWAAIRGVILVYHVGGNMSAHLWVLSWVGHVGSNLDGDLECQLGSLVGHVGGHEDHILRTALKIIFRRLP